MNENLKALLVLNQLPGFGIQKLKAYLEEYGSPSEIVKRCQKGKLTLTAGKEGDRKQFSENIWPDEVERILDQTNPEDEFEKCSRMGVRFLGYGQADYPQSLYQIYDPPMLLYVRGNFFPENFCCLAIVGTRDPSHYGMETARKFASFLAQAGIPIVSGFAKGIDAEAHRGALSVNGGTIAVLGCGVDKIYPLENEDLYRQILEKGALVSEFPLGTLPLPGNFPRRNRLISGLSLGVLVVEAHEKSGSLITASLALEQGKEVFAIPGRIDSLRSRGTNRLIKQGACLVEFPEEILVELEPLLKSYLKHSLQEETAQHDSEKDPILCALHTQALSLEELTSKTEMKPEKLSSRLTFLEIKRKVKKLPGGKFSLVS